MVGANAGAEASPGTQLLSLHVENGFRNYSFSIRVYITSNVVPTVICLDTLNWNAGRSDQVDL